MTEQPTPSPVVIAQAVAHRREYEVRREALQQARLTVGEYGARQFDDSAAQADAVVAAAEKYETFLTGTTPADDPASAQATPDGLPIVRVPVAVAEGFLRGIEDAASRAG